MPFAAVSRHVRYGTRVVTYVRAYARTYIRAGGGGLVLRSPFVLRSSVSVSSAGEAAVAVGQRSAAPMTRCAPAVVLLSVASLPPPAPRVVARAIPCRLPRTQEPRIRFSVFTPLIGRSQLPLVVPCHSRQRLITLVCSPVLSLFPECRPVQVPLPCLRDERADPMPAPARAVFRARLCCLESPETTSLGHVS